MHQSDFNEAPARLTPFSFFAKVVQGILIGLGGILPGVSGGLLCVIFGLYRPIMATLSNPVRNIRKYYRILIPVILGVLIGFFGLAHLVSVFMEANVELSTCVFVGLILGMLPSLWRDAGKEGRGKGAYVAMAVTFVLLLGFLLYLQFGTAMNITPNIGWFFFAGVIWGVSIIVPGTSSSSTLLFFGLYQPMMDGLSSFDPAVVLPLLAGIAVLVLSLSRAVDVLFTKQYAIINHVIVGAVLASTLPIIPYQFESFTHFLLDFAFILIGGAGAFFMDRFFEHYRKKHPEAQ